MEAFQQSLMDFIKLQQEQNQAQQGALLTHLTKVFAENAYGQHIRPGADTEFRMESLGQGIAEFEYDPDNEITFDAWYLRYETLFTEDAVNLPDSAKTRLLLRKLSTRCHSLYLNSILPQKPNDISFADTVTHLKNNFGKQESLFSTRYKCLQLVKSDIEDFSAYSARVNKQCEDFKLAELTSNQFKCLVFVCGLQSHHYEAIRMKLLSTIDGPDAASVTLQSLVTECHRVASLKKDTALVEVNTVNGVQHKNRTASRQTNSGHQQQQQQSRQKPKNDQKKNKPTPKTPCWFCGGMHYARDCSFKSHTCHQCNKKGHKEGYCEVNKSSRRARNQSSWTNQSSSTNTIIRVNHVNQTSRKYITVHINDRACQLQFDTGSDITVINQETYNQIGKPSSQASNTQARNASGGPILINAEFQCNVTFGQTSFSGICYVTPSGTPNLLGIDWIDELGLWDIPISSVCHTTTSVVPVASRKITDNIMSQFPAVFHDSPGLCQKFKVELRVKPDAQPVFRPKRPVPFAVIGDIDKEIDRLQSLGIIEAVEYSRWAAPIVAVRKHNGSTRICADFSTGLNDALEPYPYPLPTPEDIFTRLSDCKVFSLIDLSDAFFQVQVHENSQEFLTINTHRGLFRYRRLPFGVKVAPGAFQQVMDMMIAGLDGTSAYMDDILVYGKDTENHNRNLSRLFERIQQFGFTIKAEKCKIAVHQLEYLGHILSSNGIHPNPEKTRAIAQMPAPNDFATLRSYLGAINFYGKFISQMHDLRHPLNQLLKKDAKWSWTPQCQQSFEEFKQILQSDLLLTHFNPELDLIVAGDASNTGIGACILHRFPDGTVKAIYHASRTLTNAEKNYSQIEKEGLALIFAVTKFHRMIYGRKFILQTDHKPLLAIFGSKKGIPVYTANRLQRWALTLRAYDFSIEYVQTDHFGHADVLSRLISSHSQPSIDEDTVVASIMLERDFRCSLVAAISTIQPITHADIANATQQSDTLKSVMYYIQNGWPNKHQITNQIAPYYARRSSLSICGQCLMFGTRVVIPDSFHRQILQRLHQDHPGQCRMKSLARSFVYWPAMDKQIEEYVRNCSKCIETSKSPIRVPLHPWKKPSGPWSRIHIDFAGPVNGLYFFVIIDAFSKWPEVHATKTITTSYTTDILSSLFSRFGNPEVIVSDNGTQFTSAVFHQFCIQRGIEHIRTAPYHPQSNGQAERFVDTFKRALRKFQEGGGTPLKQLESFLATYRATPNRGAPDGKSPSELFIGRRIRTTLDLLLPTSHPESNEDDSQYVEHQYNRKHGVKAKAFAVGDAVYVQKHVQNKKPEWTPGIVIERIGHVMYNIHIKDVGRNKLVRAHVDQMQPRTAQDFSSDTHSIPLTTFLDVFDINPHRAQFQSTPTQRITDVGSVPTSTAGVVSSPAPAAAEVSITSARPQRPVRSRRAPAYQKDYELF